MEPEAPARVPTDHITTSLRDPAELGGRLQDWLAATLPAGADPEVRDVVAPEGNGMSSETLLFTARWQEAGQAVEHRFVARIEPDLAQFPVFPNYDLAMQYQVIGLVGEHTKAPVPTTRWLETDPTVVGSPFFVMDRVDGQVPPDVLPYTFGGNWLDDATPEQWDRLQRSAVAALVEIHQITPETHDLSFLASQPTLPAPDPGLAETGTALERHLGGWDRYLAWVTEDEPSPLLEECFAWLHANLPATTEARLSWGDARIGNMLFVDHEVSAVLDWEMACIAPPQVDLGWMIYLHWFFQDIGTDFGLPGRPDLFGVEATAATYRELSGTEPGDLKWYLAYAAMRHGAIMRRVTERSIRFGEAERPAHPDETIIHRRTLREMLDGTYWARLGL
jgi:aminoglycoside phosphotransferase (APT) family kinase protein